MSDIDRKMKGTEGLTMFTPLVRTASKEYTCDGCGECPISPGDTYMVSAARTPGGFSRRRYCIRCILAIEVKKAFTKGEGVAVEPGDLKLSRLSSKFQKAWLTLCKGIRLAEKEGDAEGPAAGLYGSRRRWASRASEPRRRRSICWPSGWPAGRNGGRR